MMTNRRGFLGGLIAAGATPLMTWADVGNPAFLSAARNPFGASVLCGLSHRGSIVFEIPLPTRGHAASSHPSKPLAVAFARRPGTYAIVIDCVSGQVIAQLESPKGRHFYGHGTFSADGELLFITENDFENAVGKISIWETRHYSRIGEFSSGGIGPHDITRLPNTDILVVANGGIETHPDVGGVKLNIPTMEPNLSYLSITGQVLEQVQLAKKLHKNSIRHLAVTANGTVGFAMQWQGQPTVYPPLLGFHQLGNAPVLCAAPPEVQKRMRGYAGSIAFDDAGATAIITSPRGHIAMQFDVGHAKFSKIYNEGDVCGLSYAENSFVMTSGAGTFARISDNHHRLVHHDYAWDNHLIRISKT